MGVIPSQIPDFRSAHSEADGSLQREKEKIALASEQGSSLSHKLRFGDKERLAREMLSLRTLWKIRAAGSAQRERPLGTTERKRREATTLRPEPRGSGKRRAPDQARLPSRPAGCALGGWHRDSDDVAGAVPEGEEGEAGSARPPMVGGDGSRRARRHDPPRRCWRGMPGGCRASRGARPRACSRPHHHRPSPSSTPAQGSGSASGSRPAPASCRSLPGAGSPSAPSRGSMSACSAASPAAMTRSS